MRELKEFLWNNEFEKAIQLCKIKLDSDPNNPNLWYYLFLAENKNFTEALASIQDELAYTKAIELASGDFKVNLERSIVFYNSLCSLPYYC